MSDWTTAADIRAKVQREWERGRILASLYGGDELFPLVIPLRGPRGEALTDLPPAFPSKRAQRVD